MTVPVKIPKEFVPEDDDLPAEPQEGLEQDDIGVTQAKKQFHINSIDALSSVSTQIIKRVLPTFIVGIMLCLFSILFFYTIYLVIDFKRLDVFLRMAWKVIACGSPFTLLFIWLNRQKK